MTTATTTFAQAPTERPLGSLGHCGFLYGPGSSVFGSRPGGGPLLAAVDTNVVIDITQQLDEVDRFGFGALAVELWDDPVVALGDLLAVWFWRDVRFFVPESILEDGSLTPGRLRARKSAVEAFAADWWHRGGNELGGWSDDGYHLERLAPVSVHEHQLQLDIAHGKNAPMAERIFPRGFDGDLVLEALGAHCHVLLTCDRDITRCAERLFRAGLWVGSPEQLLRDLHAAREFRDQSPGDAPAPDLLTLANFYALQKPDDE
jgi:hypothetical protein